MQNVVEKPNVYSKTNAMLVGATGVVGALGGVAKSHFLDKPDVKRGLEKEFQKYRRAVAQNEIDIKDEFVLNAKNKELRDNFNNLCDYWYNTGLKKANRKNIFVGIAIGIMAGIVGVVAKNKLKKDKSFVNENNANKIQYYNQQK